MCHTVNGTILFTTLSNPLWEQVRGTSSTWMGLEKGCHTHTFNLTSGNLSCVSGHSHCHK